MCLICIELDRHRMSVVEARRAFGEMRVDMDAKHAREVEDKLAEAEAHPAPSPVKARVP